MLRKSLGLALSLFAGLVQAAPIVTVLIDDFSTYQEEIVKKKGSVLGPVICTSFGPSGSCSITHDPAPGIQVNGSGILGGYRDLYLSTGSVSGAGTKGISATSSSSLVINNDTGVAGTAILVWDGSHKVTADPSNNANIATNGLGGVDFVPTPGSFGILLDVFSIDLSTTAILDLWDMDGDKASAMHTFSAVGSHVFLFSDFLTNNPLLDLDSIGAVRLTVTGPAAWDGEFKLIGVTSIPEPNALALLGLGLLGVGTTLGRRQKI